MATDPRPTRRAFLVGLPAALLVGCTAARAPRSSPPQQTSSPTTPPTTAAAALPTFIASGPRNRPAVALTFHGSGDPGLLDDLLAVAHAHGAALTIFAVGQWLDANPSVSGRIADGGHELANHTYTHPVLSRLAPDEIVSEIDRCRNALARHSGSPGRWFRPSGVQTPGATILAAAEKAGYPTVVGYDVDPRDYLDPGGVVVRSRVAAGLRPGSIVSLHTGHRGTVDALPGIVAEIRGQGLQPVTVSDLLRP